MAYSQCPSFDVLVPALLEHGPLVRFQLMPTCSHAHLYTPSWLLHQRTCITTT